MLSPSSPFLIRTIPGWLCGPCCDIGLNERIAGISNKKEMSPEGKSGIVLIPSCLPKGSCGVNIRRIGRRINSKRSNATLHCSPIKISVISFKLWINQILKTLSGYRIVILFLPNSIIGSFHPVLPYAIGTTSKPAHPGTSCLRIRKDSIQPHP